jgi:integrase
VQDPWNTIDLSGLYRNGRWFRFERQEGCLIALERKARRQTEETGDGRREKGGEAMSVYKPRRKGDASKFYVCEFLIHGKRIQESTGSTSKTVAKEYEKGRRAELERAAAGMPTEQKANRIRTVAEVVTPYLYGYELNHRAKSVLFSKGRLEHVKRILGTVFLSDLTEDRVRGYIRQRQGEKVSGRTINMEIGELSRAIGQPWSLLWPKVKKMEERKDVGRALPSAEQHKLLDGLKDRRTPHLLTLVPLLLLTGMRAGEALSLTWGQVDLIDRSLRVGRAKTSNGTGRVIPINDELGGILASHRRLYVERFGEPEPGHHLFPWGKPVPMDPTRHATDITWGWDELRKDTGVQCRLHDLRHTFATRLAENGAAESTMLALMGHMSRSMLERYSHIRMAAKREAVAGVTLRQQEENSQVVPVKLPVVESITTIQ